MLSQILALIIAIVLFSALLQGKYPRYLLTLAAGGAMVLVVLLGTMGSPAAALEALSVDTISISASAGRFRAGMRRPAPRPCRWTPGRPFPAGRPLLST